MNRKPYRDGLNLSPNHQHRPISSIKDYRRYKIDIIKNGTTKPIGVVFGGLSWGDNIESLGVELNLTLPKNVDDRLLKPYDIAEIGDGLILKNLEEVIFEGIIENIDEGRYSKSITCYDYGFLLGKTSILKQFNGVSGHAAIKSVCEQKGIPIGNIETMGIKITEIYKGESVSDIFKDIIEQENKNSGKRLFMEMRKGKLYIENANNNVIKLSHKPAANIGAFDPTEVPGAITRNNSNEDMRNHVQVVYEKTEDKNTTVSIVANAENSNSIRKYGRRTHIETVNKEELNNAQNIANNKLRELEGVRTETTVELLGDDRLRSGKVIEFSNKTYNLSGRYIVLNCEHSYDNNNRKMKLDIEGV